MAARTDREKALLEIWHSILNVKKIGVYDNFFELGGDSILSIQVIARAKQAGLPGRGAAENYGHPEVVF